MRLGVSAGYIEAPLDALGDDEDSKRCSGGSRICLPTKLTLVPSVRRLAGAPGDYRLMR